MSENKAQNSETSAVPLDKIIIAKNTAQPVKQY